MMRSQSVLGFHYSNDIERPCAIAAFIQERNRMTQVQNRCVHPDVWILDYLVNLPINFALDNLPLQERPQRTAHLYPPGKLYMEHHPAGMGKSGFFIFKGASPALLHLVDNDVGFAQILDPDLHLYDLLRKGAYAAAEGNRGYWKMNMVFCQVMDLLEDVKKDSKISWRYTISAPGENFSFSHKVAFFLKQNYKKRLTLDQIASALQCSKSTIVHKLKQEHGESAMEMLMRIRVEQSIPMLLAGNSLKEIAETVGVANEFYYSRIFRKIIGISPKEYRQRYSL